MSANHKVHRFAAVVLAAGLLAAGLLAPAPASIFASVESVDFSRPPAEGVSFKVTEIIKVDAKGKVTVGENEIEVEQSVTGKDTFIQKIREVKDGKVTKIDREYEEAGRKEKFQNSMMPEPQEVESPNPLAWKTVRGEWKDEEFALEVKDGDDWKTAGEKIRKALTPELLLQPIIPLPREKKNVGDSWELDTKEVKKHFPASRFDVPNGEVEGTFKAKLRSLEDLKGVKCAVLQFQFEITLTAEGEPEMTFKVEGAAHYSLEHRIVVAAKARGAVKMQGETERGSQVVTQELSGDLTVEYKVKILDRESE